MDKFYQWWWNIDMMVGYVGYFTENKKYVREIAL